jgi:hypothetical protein
MPILCQTAAPTSSGLARHPSIMALPYVGPRCYRTVSYHPGGYKHIQVVIDKFTKWIEVRPVAKVTSEEAAKFIIDITHCFGVPNRIITDLGAAFTGSIFWESFQDNTINVYYSSVAHPRCNGQVERANDMVLQALKDRIYDDTSSHQPIHISTPVGRRTRSTKSLQRGASTSILPLE